MSNIYCRHNALIDLFFVTDMRNEEIIVTAGEKLNIKCSPYPEAEASWYKDNEILKAKLPRIRVIKQSLKFKYVEVEDSGMYGCRLEFDRRLEWRNVSIRVETLQNDGYQEENENLGTVMAALRPEEETNELDLGSRSKIKNYYCI